MVLTHPKPTTGMSGRHRATRVLVVEDEPSTARLLEFVLTKQGYEAETAADGPEALAFAAEFRPDVILLDLQLPGMSGLEVLQQVRAAPGGDAVVVVILTAGAFEEAPAEVREAQAQAFRSKPLAPSTLFHTLEALGAPPRSAVSGTPTR